jgi:transcriptional regulator with XRE-family HTH domain
MALAGMAEADGKTLKPDARTKLAAALEISKQAVGQVLTGKTNALTCDKSARAARFLKVDHFWLATGEGEPRPPGLSEEAKSFALRYDRLNSNERTRWSALLVAARDGVPDAVIEEQMPITAKTPTAAKKKQPEKQRH